MTDVILLLCVVGSGRYAEGHFIGIVHFIVKACHKYWHVCDEDHLHRGDHSHIGFCLQ